MGGAEGFGFPRVVAFAGAAVSGFEEFLVDNDANGLNCRGCVRAYSPEEGTADSGVDSVSRPGGE